jgi:predicted Zn-dependent protease
MRLSCLSHCRSLCFSPRLSPNFSWAVTVAVALSLAGCAKNPATGQRQLSLISEAQEVELGRQAAQEAQQQIGLVRDPELQQYVSRIGLALAAKSERPELPWQFQVVDDPSPNAFALPGGFIFVTRGMLTLMTSEAELASVLGHEIAHVTARHSVNQISKQQLAQIGLGLGGILFPTVQELSPAIGSGLGLLFLKYGRDDEREADELGFAYASAGGYDVSEFGDVFEALGRASEGQEGALPTWLASHPSSEERVKTARARAAATPPPPNAREGRDDFLRRIDGLVYGKNPRDGFFRDGTFYHPDLQFQFRVPAGWQGQNLTQAVVAAAPDGAAAVELTLVPVKTAEEGLRRFTAQQGLQVGNAGRRTLNGLPTVGAEFAAQAQGTQVRGLVFYVEHRERVYQLVGYTAAQRFGAHSAAIVSTLESFAPVRDPAVLNVQPNRVEIVRLDRAQTLAEFAQRYKSSVDLQELAVINHVPDASTRLPAGTLVKRVS